MIEALGVSPPLHVPVVNESLLNPEGTSVLPFFGPGGKFRAPYSLSSKAPFASSKRFCFIQVGNEGRLAYGNNMEHLFFPLHKQAQRLYAPALAAKTMKFGDLADPVSFGNKFLDKVYVLGGVFEVLQTHCRPHLSLSQARTSTKPINVLQTPVLNPHHRGVLDDGDQANLLVTVEELNQALAALNKGNKKMINVWAQAESKNELYTRYGNECFDRLLETRGNGSSDCDAVVKQHKEIVTEFLGELQLSDALSAKNQSKFVLQKDASTCGYPGRNKSCEPAVSMNAFFPWNSAADFAVKHCNPSQLFGQQLLRNPALCIEAGASVMNSLLGPVQLDTSLFINNTSFLVGSYEQPVAKAVGGPKVRSLTSAVSLHAVGVVTRATLEILLRDEIDALERADEDDEAEFGQQQEKAWRGLENVVSNILR